MASCVAKTIKCPGDKKKQQQNNKKRKQKNIPRDELAECSPKQHGLGGCYCDGRWIGVWLILPGVRCGAVGGGGAGGVDLGGGLRLFSNPSLKSVLGLVVGYVCVCVCGVGITLSHCSYCLCIPGHCECLFVA